MEKLPKAEAHDEALRMNAEIDEHEARLRELKGTPEAQTEKPASREKLKYRVTEIPLKMVNEPLSEVYEYLKKTYGEDKLAKFPDNPNTLPDEFKDAKRLYFFGEFHNQDGRHLVLHTRRVDGEWPRLGALLDTDWESNARVVLLED